VGGSAGMTPKEKARELYLKYMNILPTFKYDNPIERVSISKHCAIMSAYEVLYNYPTDPYKTLQPTDITALQYWREVIQEIPSL